MCFWRQSGKNLENQIGELTIPKVRKNLLALHYFTSHSLTWEEGFSATIFRTRESLG